MTFKSIQLLKRLEPPIRPAFAGAHAAAPRAALENRSFGQLLALVSDGSMPSDRPVAIEFEPPEAISDEQLARLSSASDLAESAGARRALMLIDGRGLVLDVSGRRLVEELTSTGPDQVVPLDAAVYVAGEDEHAVNGSIRFPGTGLVPRAVAEQIQLARTARNTDVADDSSTPNHVRRTAG